MAMSGAIYPPIDYVQSVVDQGYLIYVNSNLIQVGIMWNGDIELALRLQPKLIVVTPAALIGTEADIRRALSEFSKAEIDAFVAAAIGIHNLEFIPKATHESMTPPFPGFTGAITPYTLEYIAEQRLRIHDQITADVLNGNPNFETLSQDVLDHLFYLYDLHFFQTHLSQLLIGSNLKLSWARLTSSGGMCKQTGACEYEITLSGPILLNTFTTGSTKYRANGLMCVDRLACAQSVFEHELIHLVIFSTGHAKTNPHGKLFRAMAYAYFGHTEHKHALKSSNDEFLTRGTVHVGQTVSFTLKNGNRITGKIDRINPTTVQIGDYRVPFSMLRTVHTLSEPAQPTERAQSSELTHQFHIGQTVSFVDRHGKKIVGVISKINPTTARVGTYRVPFPLLTATTDAPTVISKSARDFRLGQLVHIMVPGRTQASHTGRITKLNPTTAIIVTDAGVTYKASYGALVAVL